MAQLQDQAVVLRRLDYSETSQVLALFGRSYGQQRVIAKGIKRSKRESKPAIEIDLLELGRAVFTHRPHREEGLSILVEWVQEERFAGLRRELTRLYAGQYAAEVTAQLTEPVDPHPGLFDGLVEALRSLETDPVLPTLNRFCWLLMREIGLLPEMGRCMNCGTAFPDRPMICHFSSREGGAICRDCEGSIVEKRQVSAALGSALRAGRLEASPLAMEAFELSDYHLSHLMGRPPRLSAPLKQALRSPGAASLRQVKRSPSVRG